ncbi:MAG: Uma2 family endonuclease, partial [Dehalococcoidia bacterium]
MVQATSSAAGRSKWPRMSYEEYLCDSTIPRHTEWVDGEVVEMMSVSKAHAQTVRYLLQLLEAYLVARPLGDLYFEPFNMKTAADLPGRSPDIMFVSAERADAVGDLSLQGPADVVIEVISPGTEGTDRGDKFLEYEQGGVAEYWVVDPLREIADFYVRGEDGLFRSGSVDADGSFASTVLPGLRIHPGWLWARR